MEKGNEDTNLKHEHKDGFGSGSVVLILIILAGISALSYWIGTKSARDSVSKCECQCKMPACAKVECPPQVLVDGDYTVRPIRVTPCKCEAWCAGGGSPSCRVMKPDSHPVFDPDNYVCEED